MEKAATVEECRNFIGPCGPRDMKKSGWLFDLFHFMSQNDRISQVSQDLIFRSFPTNPDKCKVQMRHSIDLIDPSTCQRDSWASFLSFQCPTSSKNIISRIRLIVPQCCARWDFQTLDRICSGKVIVSWWRSYCCSNSQWCLIYKGKMLDILKRSINFLWSLRYCPSFSVDIPCALSHFDVLLASFSYQNISAKFLPSLGIW